MELILHQLKEVLIAHEMTVLLSLCINLYFRMCSKFEVLFSYFSNSSITINNSIIYYSSNNSDSISGILGYINYNSTNI